MTDRSERRGAGRGPGKTQGRSPAPGPRGARGAASTAARGTEGTDRTARVGERIRAELSDMLLRGDVRDPAAVGAIVSAVTVTRDLSLARVYLRVLEAAPSDARRAEIVAAFERAKGHVRRELAARIARGSGAMRSVPELRFAWDDTADRAARLDEVFAEVAADRARATEHEAGGSDEP
ncbi:MAG: 30S ribosome-binding factor RbfA [Sandaracinus sp.]